MEKKYLDMLDDIISRRRNDFEYNDYKQFTEEQEQIYLDSIKHEYPGDTIEYNNFLEKLEKLYYKFENDGLYRIDKILDLFNGYLFTSSLDDLYIDENISIYNYIKIAEKYFEFLRDNYYELFNIFDEFCKIKKEKSDIKLIEGLILDIYNSHNNSGEEEHQDITTKYSYLHHLLIEYYNPFNKDFIKLLLRLYKIINNHSFDGFIIYELIEFDMREELFEFIINAPNKLNGRIIDMIYDPKSANIVYNILSEKVNRIESEKNNIDLYYFQILELLKETKDEYLSGVYNEFKNRNIKDYNVIYDKVKLFRELDLKLFKELDICGTFGGYFCEGIFSSFDLAEELREIDILALDDNNKEDLSTSTEQEDKFDFSYLNSDKEDVSLDDQIDNFCYWYLTSDKITENKLRLLYQEIKNSFIKLDNDLESIKLWNKQFLNIPNVDKILKEVNEKKEIYELEEIRKKIYLTSDKQEYDSEIAEKLLSNDFNIINVTSEKYINMINNYPKVRKVLLSAVHLWNLYSNSQNMTVDKDGQDYTPIVSNYFKTIEILLYRRIRDKYQKLVNEGVIVKKPYSVSGKVINLLDNNDNDITLGEMLKYLKRENKLVNSECDYSYFIEELEMWIIEVRNSHFHKDLILSKLKVIDFKNRTLKLIVDILDYIC